MHVKVRYILPQQGTKECLPERIRRSGSRNTNAQRADIADDEAGDEKIYEVENQMVDSVLERLRVHLAARVVTERTCR